MLKILRDNLKYLSWILWIVILVFVVFVFVDFGGGLTGTGGRSGIAATVGDTQIGYREFQRTYKQLEERYRNAFGGQWSSEMADRMQLPQQALTRLVDRVLISQEARRQGIRVGDADVRAAILQFPALLDAKGDFVGEQHYRDFLSNIGYSTREFENAIREDLTIQRFSALLAAGVAIPDAEVERSWRDQNEKAEIRYLLAPTGRYQGAVQPTAGEIEAYFKAHQSDFHLPEQRVVDYLLVDAAKIRASIQIDPADVRSEYDSRQSEFTLPEQVHARHILIKVDENRTLEQAQALMAKIQARLAKGESFEKLAGEYSEDPGSKDRGGDLGSFGRGSMVPPFEQAAFDAKPGSVVGPIQTSFGLHLIQVLEHSAGHVRPFSEVEAQIRAQLAAQRAEREAEARARQLESTIASQRPATDDAWKALADGTTIEFLSTPKFGRNDPLPGIGANPAFAGAAFALASPGASSAPVQVPRGWAILRLKEIVPAHQPELAEVEARVRAALVREQANQKAEVELARAKSELAGGKSLDAVAAELGLEARDSGEFARDGSIQGLGPAPHLAAAAMQLDAGAVGGPLVTPVGAVLFRVVKRTPFDAAKFAAERQATLDQLRRTEADRLLGSLLERRRQEVGVTYDPELVERFKLGGAAG